MVGLQVGAYEFEVALEGFGIGVAHEVHEGYEVHAGAETFEGEGAAEVVEAVLGDGCIFGATTDDLAEASGSEAFVVFVGPKGVCGFDVWAGAEVADEFAAGFGSEVGGAVFVAFACDDLDGSGFEVDVVEVEFAEFFHAEAGVDEEVDYGAVSDAVLGFGRAGGDEFADFG